MNALVETRTRQKCRKQFARKNIYWNTTHRFEQHKYFTTLHFHISLMKTCHQNIAQTSTLNH